MSKSSVIALAAAVILFASLQPSGAVDGEFKIVPGVRIGLAHLGMSSAQVKKAMGNIDGEYKLAGGGRVEFAEWKEKDPARNMYMKYFYDRKGQVVQIMTNAPMPETAENIGMYSSVAAIRERFPRLTDTAFEASPVTPVEGRTASGHCLDERQAGIAFCLRSSTKGGPEELAALIIHRKGQNLLIDKDEN